MQQAQTDIGSSMGFDGGGSGSFSAPVAAQSSIQQSSGYFDVSAAAVAGAEARGNTRSDVISAYQTYQSGVSTGRGGTYAADNIKRGRARDLREGAAAYLRDVGIPFVEFFTRPIINPEPAPDDSGVVTTPVDITGEGDPFARLADLFKEYYSQGLPAADPTAPVVVVGDSGPQQTSSGGTNAGLLIVLLLAGGGAFYWFYLRKRMAGGGN